MWCGRVIHVVTMSGAVYLWCIVMILIDNLYIAHVLSCHQSMSHMRPTDTHHPHWSGWCMECVNSKFLQYMDDSQWWDVGVFSLW